MLATTDTIENRNAAMSDRYLLVSSSFFLLFIFFNTLFEQRQPPPSFPRMTPSFMVRNSLPFHIFFLCVLNPRSICFSQFRGLDLSQVIPRGRRSASVAAEKAVKENLEKQDEVVEEERLPSPSSRPSTSKKSLGKRARTPEKSRVPSRGRSRVRASRSKRSTPVPICSSLEHSPESIHSNSSKSPIPRDDASPTKVHESKVDVGIQQAKSTDFGLSISPLAGPESERRIQPEPKFTLEEPEIIDLTLSSDEEEGEVDEDDDTVQPPPTKFVFFFKKKSFFFPLI